MTSRFRLMIAIFGAGLALGGESWAHEGAIRINCGGPEYVDTLGKTWGADTYFANGSTFSVGADIGNTSNPTLYQTERYGSNVVYNIPLADDEYDITLHFAEIYFGAAGRRLIDVMAEGVLIIDDLDLGAQYGKFNAATFTIPVDSSGGTLDLEFIGVLENAKISAIEILEKNIAHPFLHVVIDAPSNAVDYDGDSVETVTLLGAESHTHEIGHALMNYTWKLGETILGTDVDLNAALPVGTHTISLTIEDDNVPAETLTDFVVVSVDPVFQVSGVVTRYMKRLASGSVQGIGIDTIDTQPNFEIMAAGNLIGGSALQSQARIRMEGEFKVTQPGYYEFQVEGATRSRIVVDGTRVTESTWLYPGFHRMKVALYVGSVQDLPARLLASFNAGPFVMLPPGQLTHDESQIKPFLNHFDDQGSAFGGQTVILPGVGFVPSESVQVFWGTDVLSEPDIVVTPKEITLITPAGTGTVPVTVQTPNGMSNPRTFQYDDGEAPIIFTTETIAVQEGPTQGVFGPDGRFYVGSIGGEIHIYTFDDFYAVADVQVVTTISALSNPSILGITFDPTDPADPPRLYVAHGELFANGGECFQGTSAYSGQISALEGPNFDVVESIITGLPVSNHDHGVNGIEFDAQGNLFILVGGNTNAGVSSCPIGGIPESPLSASMLIAPLHDPSFYGFVEYEETFSGFSNNDQVFGEDVDIAAGDVRVYASGLRNAFDFARTTRGFMYATDNGPNDGFGPSSLTATSEGPDPNYPDEMVFVAEGHYYGHPNRNRGRFDPRQNTFYSTSDASVFGAYTAPLTTHGSSINGITEYRAETFGGSLRGELILQKWNGKTYINHLDDDGRGVLSVEELANGPAGLDVVHGPGGVILGIDYSDDMITVTKPTDILAFGLTAYDVFPWRALADGSTPFVIGGENFGTLANTEVRFDGQLAVLTEVTARRIRGFIPATVAPTADLLDIEVKNTSTLETSVLTQAFRYVHTPATGLGSWKTEAPAPTALGEVAGGVIHGVLYLVGEGNDATLAYDPASGNWNSSLALRPYPGHHHTAEVIDGKLYLFGGLNNNSAGKVQVYDPMADAWSLAAEMPFAPGSAASSLIDGKAYVAGGIVNGATVTDVAVYDPTLDTWATVASMPIGRNHTAAGTDGTRFYIFGGRGPGSGDGNVLAEGFDDVMIYDPVLDSWEWSGDIGSTLPPLPQKRGGMGRAVFYRGEFYVFGGETTSSGQGATENDVYDRVDVFDSATQTWRLERGMESPRHGIYPMLCNNSIYVGCGGVVAGASTSTVMEILEF